MSLIREESDYASLENGKDSPSKGDSNVRPLSRANSNYSGDSADYYYPKHVELTSNNILDVINTKIAQLDEILQDYRTLDAGSSYYELSRPASSTKLKEKSLAKEKEMKDIHRFAGIYTMKSLFYDKKINIPGSNNVVKDDVAISKIPKLIELYQFPGFENMRVNELPHDVEIDQILNKVLNSIKILKRQPKYKDFLTKIYFSEESKHIICDTFWWCFLDQYAKNSLNTQQKIFERISRNYVNIILMLIDPIYKETFFKQYANLLAMSVYTTFCTCFPESYTHFDQGFKDFLCNICHMWISGCKPLPNVHLQWNYKMLDPPQAIFANEVLTNKNKMKNIINFEEEKDDSPIEPKTNELISPISPSQNKPPLNTINQTTNRKNIKSSNKKKESHPAGKGPKMETFLFDTNGHSPLVDFFLYKTNFNKATTVESLVKHPQIVSLPPIDVPTYHDVIVNSLKISRKIQEEYKATSLKQKADLVKMKINEAKSLRTFHEKEKKLFTVNRELKYLGDLISMEAKRDPKSTSFAPDLALYKSLNSL